MAREIREIPKLNPRNLRNFWAKVDKTPGHGPDGSCWIWMAHKDKDGYGMFGFQGHKYKAHRISYTLEYGPIPRGLLGLHKCDNPGCMRPDHVWIGTTADNIKDRFRKGRSSRGDNHYSRLQPDRLSRGDNHYSRLNPERMTRGKKHHSCSFTEDQVLEIRARYKNGGCTHRGLAKEYGVAKSSIQNIVTRKTWTHLA